MATTTYSMQMTITQNLHWNITSQEVLICLLDIWTWLRGIYCSGLQIYLLLCISNPCTYVLTFHITYRYIDHSRHSFVNCLLPWFSPQSFLSWQSSQWLAKAALMGKSWKETIYKIMAGRINVFICNVLHSYFEKKIQIPVVWNLIYKIICCCWYYNEITPH